MNDQTDNPYAAPQCAPEVTRSLALSDLVSVLLHELATGILLSPFLIVVDAVWNIFWPTAFGGAPMKELPAPSICILYVVVLLWALLYAAYRSRRDHNRRRRTERDAARNRAL